MVKSPHKLADFVDFVEEEAKPDYTNVVGQDELTRFDKVFKKKKKEEKFTNRNKDNRNSNNQNNPQAKKKAGIIREDQKKPVTIEITVTRTLEINGITKTNRINQRVNKSFTY